LELDPQGQILNDPIKLLIPLQPRKPALLSKRVATTGPLLFDSRFESGNLACAVQVSGREFDLMLQNDSNTQGYIQWFFFKVAAEESGEFKFNLLNHTKANSLYNYGMRVLVAEA
jgi:hypothetical protein